MDARQRFLGALEGRALDRFPVAVPYISLLQCDHWCELTGRPAWTYYAWLAQAPDEHVQVYADLVRQLPFDLLQPQEAPTRAQRDAWEVVHRGGKHYPRVRGTTTDPFAAHAPFHRSELRGGEGALG